MLGDSKPNLPGIVKLLTLGRLKIVYREVINKIFCNNSGPNLGIIYVFCAMFRGICYVHVYLID